MMEEACTMHVPAIDPTVHVNSGDILSIIYDGQFWKSVNGDIFTDIVFKTNYYET